MASKSMLIFLKTTLQPCFIEGTSPRESGLTVSTETFPGETILFFHTDCDVGRRQLKMVGVCVKVCDYLVLYTKDNEQVELLKDGLDKNQHKHIIWKACICMHGQAPRNQQSCADQLKKVFGKENIRIKHGTKHDTFLGSFLRSTYGSTCT